jgi:hypothetical protein
MESQKVKCAIISKRLGPSYQRKTGIEDCKKSKVAGEHIKVKNLGTSADELNWAIY